ncbi:MULTISPECIES: Rieske 2Fe-2S domain-containing protein [Streptomyces]|uniref:Rieske 2Fe-2S domain-containing protein n=1 Tax=Streptomyces TaxID=1883 RepID=UPI0015E18A1A|nr:Rieske 2Fe-2S domain-containing protein [Streptomyces sp. ZL-24]
MDPVEYEMLRHMWFPVARVADLANGVASGSILGEELVVYGDGGSVTVAEGFCPHRGVALRLGRLHEGALECPYHGWLFEAGSGRCTSVPSLPPGRSRPHAVLRTYPAEIAYGLVWSCLDDPFLPLPRLPEYVDETWQLGAGEPYTLSCGMRQLTENFRDKAHFPFVHADTMGEVDKVAESYRIARDGWRLGWSSRLGSEGLPEELAEDFSHRLDYRITLPMCASICVSSPSGGRRLVAQLATPVSADGLRVRQFWLAGTDAVSCPLPERAFTGPSGVTSRGVSRLLYETLRVRFEGGRDGCLTLRARRWLIRGSFLAPIQEPARVDIAHRYYFVNGGLV